MINGYKSIVLIIYVILCCYLSYKYSFIRFSIALAAVFIYFLICITVICEGI